MIEGLFNTGSMPALERLVQFTSERHRHLINNIANLSTPNYQPTDLSVSAFEEQLGEAIDARRARHGTAQTSTDNTPFVVEKLHDNLRFHDGNNRSLENEMKSLAENTMAHNAALEMLKNQFSLLQVAIRGQV
ncbi:MAG: hypothetical protein GC162_12735 [Planctomycetes bacterium]|nr:hypothetical protein [Planctomycetota bacterium]